MERIRLLASFAKIAILSGIRGLESHTTDTVQGNNAMREAGLARVFEVGNRLSRLFRIGDQTLFSLRYSSSATLDPTPFVYHSNRRSNCLLFYAQSVS